MAAAGLGLFVVLASQRFTRFQPSPDRDERILEPCTVEQWLAETTKKAVLQGQLQYKQWTKSIESFEAGGSDYFVLYTTADRNRYVFPRAHSREMREHLRALSGKRVRIEGRWAPLVRFSPEEYRVAKQEWDVSQHPSGATCPTTWGGSFIADRVEEVDPKSGGRQRSGRSWNSDPS